MIDLVSVQPTLLAAAGDLSRAAEMLREGQGLEISPSALALLLGGVGALLTSAVAYNLLSRDRSRHGAAFRQICRSFGIDRRQQRVLITAAEQLDQPSPASLLISRGCFETAMRRLRPDRRTRATLDEIGLRVFGA